MSTWLAALILAAAIGATYFFCVRPMRRGECGPAATGEADDAERAREIAELREEIRILRATNAIESEPAERSEG